MFRALYLKELRACLPLGAPALVAMSWIAWSLSRDFSNPVLNALDVFHRSERYWKHGFEEELWTLLGLVCAGLGIAMALVQTLAESVQGTAPFLVQLGRSRHRIVAAKIAAALSVYGLAILPAMTAGLASGLEPGSPLFFSGWADTRFAWVIAGAGAAGYLALLAVGLRGFRLGFRGVALSLSGLALAGIALFAVTVVPGFGAAVAGLLLVSAFAGTWAFSGFAAREF